MMMKKYSTELLKIGGIAGTFYKVPDRSNKQIVVYGLGAPLPPDYGKLPEAPYILDFNVDLFVPDYIGYGRSEGKFTPTNCIKTFLNLYDHFTQGCTAINSYKNVSKKLKYEDVIFMGRSFAGAYMPLLPKYNPKIKNICIIYPVTNYARQGSVKGEETIGDFMKAIRLDGYKYLYRGILSKSWEKHFKNQDKLSPIQNIRYLQNCKLFIAHGKKDTNIHLSQSVDYHRAILRYFPKRKNQFYMKIYKEGDHSITTARRAISAYLKWINISREKPRLIK